MNATLGLIIAIIAIALVFDFFNGFHDAANSVATVVTTRVLSPIQAVAWAAFFNFVAAFVFGTGVAKTISEKLIDPQEARSMIGQAVVEGSDMGRREAPPRFPRMAFDQVGRDLLGRIPLRLVREPREQIRRLTPEFRKDAAVFGKIRRAAGPRGQPLGGGGWIETRCAQRRDDFGRFRLLRHGARDRRDANGPVGVPHSYGARPRGQPRTVLPG